MYHSAKPFSTSFTALTGYWMYILIATSKSAQLSMMVAVWKAAVMPLVKHVTCSGACTITSGSNGKVVGSGGSSDEASVAADCLSWLRGSDFDCCEAAVCSVVRKVLPASAAAWPLTCRLVARSSADKAAAVTCPTVHLRS